MPETTTRRYKVLGTTEDYAGCDCCGRMNLKVYVALEPTEGGEVVYFGTGCAAKAEGLPIATIRREVKTADDERKAAEHAARQAAAAADEARYHAWAIEAHGVSVDTFGNVTLPAGSPLASVWELRKAWHAARKVAA